jgi:hypothetical protein
MGLFSSIKIVAILLVLATGGIGYMYVQKLQNDLQTARDNVAKMEVAVATSEASIKVLREDQIRMTALNQQLSSDLQKAEAYGDDLRNKLSRHNLTALALSKPGLLEGKMNAATAQLWRELEQSTGGAGDNPPPSWLRKPAGETGTTDTGSDAGGANDNPNSSTTEADKPN